MPWFVQTVGVMPVWVVIDGPSFYSPECCGLDENSWGLSMAQVSVLISCPASISRHTALPSVPPTLCPPSCYGGFPWTVLSSCSLPFTKPRLRCLWVLPDQESSPSDSFLALLRSSGIGHSGFGLVSFSLLGWLMFNSLSHSKAGSDHVSYALESQMPSRFWLTEWIDKFINQSIHTYISWWTNYWLLIGCSWQKWNKINK